MYLLLLLWGGVEIRACSKTCMHAHMNSHTHTHTLCLSFPHLPSLSPPHINSISLFLLPSIVLLAASLSQLPHPIAPYLTLFSNSLSAYLLSTPYPILDTLSFVFPPISYPILIIVFTHFLSFSISFPNCHPPSLFFFLLKTITLSHRKSSPNLLC